VAAGVSARLSRGEGRRFGLTLGAAFLALAGLAAWRGHSLEARAFVGLGGALAAAALLAPALLGPVRRFWMAFAAAISSVTTPAFMGLVYFAVLTPTGLVRRLAGHNRLARSRHAKSFWVARGVEARRGTDMQRQF
jgi:hypothetical protein